MYGFEPAQTRYVNTVYSCNPHLGGKDTLL